MVLIKQHVLAYLEAIIRFTNVPSPYWVRYPHFESI